MANLAESIEDIVDAILGTLEDARQGAGLLVDEALKQVVRGSVTRGVPTPPALWVVPRAAQFSQDEYGLETWTMPVDIAAVVKSDDPDEGAAAANRLAALGLVIALTARPRITVADIIDIVSQSFDPTAHSNEANKTLLWTYATLRATFTVTQP